MGDVQTGMMFHGQFNGQTGTLIAGLLTAYLRMMTHLRIITVQTLGLRHITIDDVRILTMDHDGQTSRGEDTLQRLTTVNEHIPGRRAHKQFDTWYAVCIELFKQRRIPVCCPEEETVVDVTFTCGYTELLFESLNGCCLRHGIGHIEETGHTSCRSRTTFTLDIGLLCQSWLTEMHMVVNNAGQHKTSRSIDDLINRYLGTCISFNNLTYLRISDDDGAIEYLAFIDKSSALNDDPHFCGRLVKGVCRESGTVCGTVTGSDCCGALSSTSPFSRT